MILSVIFDDQELFDDAFRYSQHWADETGLMQWYIDPTGTIGCPGHDDCRAATDADEDIAYALIMADKQWGGQGALDKSYREYALRQIALVKEHEVTEDYILKPGNSWGGANILNLSYFAPAFFDIFGRYSNDEAYWKKVTDVNYEILFKTLNDKNGNTKNGLVPAWSNADGEPVVAFPGALTYFQTDSIRTPFRIAQHYCWTGDERAKTYLDKINQFFVSVGAGHISDGFDLDGTHHPEVGALKKSESAVFVTCAAVGAMTNTANHEFVAEAYDLVKTLKLNIRSTYYQLSWAALGLAFMTGNYFDMTTAE
jgi:endo-1,4-beta-D-glucanase Y